MQRARDFAVFIEDAGFLVYIRDRTPRTRFDEVPRKTTFISAAFAAAEAERVAVELSHLAIGQLYSGGEFRAVGGVRFREHKASIGCVAADREMLVTGDEDGNVFVRDFEPAHLGQ